MLDARHIKTDEKQFDETCQAVTKRIFAGRQHIELKDIQSVRFRMKKALLHMEFMFYVEDLFPAEVEEGQEARKKPSKEPTITM